MSEPELVHLRLAAQLMARMDHGEIAPGGRLPSARALAAEFGCSVNSAVRAYRELERQRRVYAVPKSGYFRVGGAEPPAGGDAPVNFTSASPQSAYLPIRDMQLCLQQAAEQQQDGWFGYGDPRGLPSLRESLRRLFRQYGILADPDRICVVTGVQQALSILTRMPFPNGGDTLLVEQPTYAGILDTVALHGCRVAGIDRSEAGIDLRELERLFRSGRIAAFYTVPRFLNPLGTSYTLKERQRIAELAAAYQVYIIEDDYLADLAAGPRYHPICALGAPDHGIYLKTFSKILMPGLRLGAAVLPKSLAAAFAAYKQAADVFTPVMTQAALDIYLRSGMFGRHTAVVRERYRAKMAVMRELCAVHIAPYAACTAPESGIFVTVTLPPPLKASRLARYLEERGVLVSTLDRHYLPERRDDSRIRLSVIGMDEAGMARGVAAVGRAIAHLSGRLRHGAGEPGAV